MTTILAVDDDPYAVPMPTPHSSTVLPKWIRPANTHANSRYQDAVWPLASLIDNPSTRPLSLHWKNCPKELQGQVKLAAWTMINGQLRPTLVKERGSAARARRSAEDMGGTCREWMRLARWLRKRGVTELAACTEDVWRDYAEVRWANDVSRRQAVKIMSRLTDLWAFDRLSAHPSRISRPPWDTKGVDDFLPASGDGDGGAENLTEPLAPQVIGPLLVWAIRMVEDFADDILAAWAETCGLTECARSNPSTPEGLAALKAYLLPLRETDTAIPFAVTRGKAGIARTFIAGTTGASRHQVMKLTQRYGLASLALQRPGPCPLHAPVTGRINGRPWREHMDYRETATLMRHLGTSAPRHLGTSAQRRW
ncbi:hypothetical protein [Streptomyces sp. NPDC048106]|uniref:hypothetical protein n=1 Tax=Streptomyces sp. NPDC048106 TaxID=3155750 RepID=UPI003455715C